MASGGHAVRRAGVVLRWPVGIGLASWRYMWRTTPMHRSDGPDVSSAGPPLCDALVDGRLQPSENGVGPLFHRRYRARIYLARRSPEELIARIAEDPNWACPTEVAVFRKVGGAKGRMDVGDEYVIRMPGPWDGPVRVVDRTPRSFRFATLEGHLEAGQIEFRAGSGHDHLVFEIESWARSGDRLSDALYDRLRLAKEIQLYMWTHFLQRVARITKGQIIGGIDVHTARVEDDHAEEPRG